MEKRLDYQPKDSAITFMLVLFVPTIFSIILLGLIKAIFPNIDNISYYYVALSVNQICFFLIFFLYNKLTKTNGYQASRVKFNLNIYQILIVLVIGIVALYGFTFLVNYFEYLMTLVGYKFESFSFLDVSNFGMFIITALVVSVLPAICEELLFRGIILNGIKKYGKVKMVVLSGLMFCLMHMSLEQSIYQFVLGMVMALVVMITGSILSSMILHFFNNFFIVFMAFITNGGQSVITAPQNVFEHIFPFLVAIVSLFVIYLLLLLLKKCSNNSEFDLFIFKKLSKQNNAKNIDIIKSETDENLQLTQHSNNENLDEENENLVEKPKNKSIAKFEEKLIFYGSIIIGVVVWIVMVGIDFVFKIK